MILIILASGRGSRLKNKTKNQPKCMIKIGKNMIIDHLAENFKRFNKVIIVTGYKSQKIKKYLEDVKNIIFAKNSNYLKTNMVESLFKTKKLVNEDVIVSYSDIIFDKHIIEKLIKEKKTCLPLYTKWLRIWKLRMKSLKKIKSDAENITVKDNKIYSIGGKINSKMPDFQFMGLIKIIKKDFNNMFKLYKKINNKKIDMTTFLNNYIKNQNNLFYFKTSKYWFEIDNIRDLRVAKAHLKN